MEKSYNAIFERDEDGYIVVSVPELPGCHTQATSMDEAIERIHEAITLYLEQTPELPEPHEFIGIQRIAIHS